LETTKDEKAARISRKKEMAEKTIASSPGRFAWLERRDHPELNNGVAAWGIVLGHFQVGREKGRPEP
jgi:hypothetical protein